MLPKKRTIQSLIRWSRTSEATESRPAKRRKFPARLHSVLG